MGVEWADTQGGRNDLLTVEPGMVKGRADGGDGNVYFTLIW